MEDYNMDELLSDLDFESNSYQRVNDKLILTNYQISILKANGIDPSNYTSLREIIYLAEQAYEETEDEDLEQVLYELSERDYYENTKK